MTKRSVEPGQMNCAHCGTSLLIHSIRDIGNCMDMLTARLKSADRAVEIAYAPYFGVMDAAAKGFPLVEGED